LNLQQLIHGLKEPQLFRLLFGNLVIGFFAQEADLVEDLSSPEGFEQLNF